MIRQYIDLVNMLKNIVPSNVEVVLHDANNLTNSILAIVNGHISGREVGMPVTDFTLKIINDPDLHKHQSFEGYKTHSNGKVLNSFTYVIKSENNKIIGLLCFNVDTDAVNQSIAAFANLFANQFALPNTMANLEVKEKFVLSEEELIIPLIREVIKKYHLRVDQMKSSDKYEIIRRLDVSGVFLVKGSVNDVAAELDLSVPSTYRYLQKLNKEKNKLK